MKQKEMLLLSIGIFLTVLAWVIVEVYRIQIIGVLEEEVPFPTVEEYTLDMSILETLKDKIP
jgi:hypothetical protein